MIVIDNEKYGERLEAETLEEALDIIRGCGPDFETTTLLVRLDGRIEDEAGDIVGEEI